ncbi:hypothetical protein SLITO_v1c04910 [Spiroplasma litorale]|uniref:Uncharacterized protein n=1 Tax=Spiroplasma litorale TaxID=216942 RepID=A0A0K1W213_9MOLU|nr:hypothetical protein [Spiroplasma litorale]AKX34142.1 hypothetical protein SLITO_v1c04910 [Spiroplasma litorale]
MNFNIEELIFDFYKRDVKGLLSNKQFKLNFSQKKDLISITKSDDCKKLFDKINDFFKKNIWINEYELSLMLTLITQRYNYFYQTELEWNKFFENKLFLENGNNLRENISIFFEKQINLFSNNYLDILNGFSLNIWNKSLYKSIQEIFKSIINERLLDQKLNKIKDFIKFVKNTKNIYSSLECIGIEVEKQKFLSNTNEIKIVFQSMIDLVDSIKRKIELN